MESVLPEPIVVAMYEDHPLAGQLEVAIKDLDSVPMIVYPHFAKNGLAQIASDAFRRGGARFRVEQEVKDALTAIALVSSGSGARAHALRQ